MADPLDRLDPAYEYSKQLKSLKGQITKLKNRILILELSGTQDQITEIVKKQESISNSLILLKREMSAMYILYNTFYALWQLESEETPEAQACAQYVTESSQAARIQISNSNDPRKIANNWFSSCAEYFKTHGYSEIFKPPYIF